MNDKNLPTYQQLLNAFCDVLDGVQDHDIQAMTGLPDEDCDFIINVRRAVKPHWEVNGERNFG